MPSNPVVAGFELSAAELQLLTYWLGDRPGFRRVDKQEVLRGRGGLLFLAEAGEAQLQELLEWNLPLLIVVGRTARSDREVFYERMRAAGAAAIWELKGPDAILVPPPLDYETTGTAFLLDDRQTRRRRYRQALFYCGYDLRVDFRDSADLLTTLGEQAGNGRPPRDPAGAGTTTRDAGAPKSTAAGTTTPGGTATAATAPAPERLLIVDLDSTRLDARAFFPALRRFFSDQPDHRRTTQVLLTKDFRRTGADLELLAAHIRPLARRIFAPEEALFALLEGLLYAPWVEAPRPAGPQNQPVLRPLRQLLTGDKVRLHEIFPAEFPPLELLRRAQLFRWLYGSEPAEAGLLLAQAGEQ